MTLDRAWSRRPLVSPARWGASVPDIWADTEVTFASDSEVENSLGGFSDGPDQPFGPIMANVSIDTEVTLRSGNDSMAGSEASGPLRTRRYLVIFDVHQLDGIAYRPTKGDRMSFQDPRFAAGEPVTVIIASAVMPLNAADHWELESESWE